MGWALIGAGVVLMLLVLGFAFTPYAYACGAGGLLCLAVGSLRLSRRPRR